VSWRESKDSFVIELTNEEETAGIRAFQQLDSNDTHMVVFATKPESKDSESKAGFDDSEKPEIEDGYLGTFSDAELMRFCRRLMFLVKGPSAFGLEE
jgi:hypothetical protein